MKNIAVIYQSVYGTTQRYAAWIAEELGASLLKASDVKPAQLMDYGVVVYGGGLYAGGILGVSLVAKNPCPPLVVFTVGLATPAITDYSDILAKNFTAARLAECKVFHLHGGMDYKKLGVVHKTMMAMKKREAEKKPVAERTGDDRALIETYGGQFDFTERAAIAPLVEYVRAMVL